MDRNRFNKNRTHKGKKAKSTSSRALSTIPNFESAETLSISPIDVDPSYSAYNTFELYITISSNTSTPITLDRTEQIVSALPEAPTGKLTSKKKKRLEKFIEKSLKKEQRNYKRENAFDANGLFKSSKSLGQNKLTMREKLRITLLETKAGLEPSQGDNRLFVERVVGESDVAITNKLKPLVVPKAPETFDDMLDSDMDDTMSDVEVDPSAKTIQVVTLDGNFTTSTMQSIKAAPFGAGLKRSNTDEVSEVVSKRKKKSKPTQVDAETTDSEAEMQVKTIPNPRSKVWSSNVVDGEKIENGVDAELLKLTRILKEKEALLPVADPISSTVTPVQMNPAFYVKVNRPAHIQLSRESLPVVQEEQRIMEAIIANPIIILCGSTGSGKTSQIGQFLYEAGFGDRKHPTFPGLIGITQPRRVAAISMAKRVAEEMNLSNGEVAHQVRFDSSTVTANTRIKFMTDGILLRELSMAATDPSQSTDALLLMQYSCIVIDEAHERTVGTDVLIGWLSRISQLRTTLPNMLPLKIVIMSATLRVQDFTGNKLLFPVVTPPVLEIEGRQYKVSVHYNKLTPEVDYVEEAFKKVCKIHAGLPKGGILVFMSGQAEIQRLGKMLEKRFPVKKSVEDVIEDDEVVGDERDALGNMEEIEEAGADMEFNDDYDEMNFESDDEEEDVHYLDGASDDEEVQEAADTSIASKQVDSLYVLPLYSLLSTAAQMRVFDAPPPNARICVLATNVAETSVTIPNIKYVIDCGKVKERQYDPHTQTQTFQIAWTSKASADQRGGRAGRTSSGHCYRLFSSAVFNDYFPLFSTPEIMRVPIESVVLQMRAMGISKVIGFPFPTVPPQKLLESAERLLKDLGALREGKITSDGKLMANIPVSPRFAKMYVQQKDDVLQYLITLVCGLAVGELFVHDDDIHKARKVVKSTVVEEESDEDVIRPAKEDSEDEQSEETKETLKLKRTGYYKIMQIFAGTKPTSDPIKILRAISAYLSQYSSDPHPASLSAFCESHFLREKAMEEVRKLLSQVSNIVKTVLGDSKVYPNVAKFFLDPRVKPPSAQTIDLLQQLLFTGYPDHVARLKSVSAGPNGPATYTALTTDDATEELCIHASSCLISQRPPAPYLIYTDLVGREQRININNTDLILTRGASEHQFTRLWMKGVTIINESWLSTLGPDTLVHKGKVLESPEPLYDAVKDAMIGFVKPRYGPKSWDMKIIESRIQELRTRVVWFMKKLMDGGVALTQGKEDVNVFKLLTPYYLLKTTALPKVFAQNNSKVSGIVEKCVALKIDSRASFIRALTADSSLMKREIGAWLPADLQSLLVKHWPPVLINAKGKASPNQALVDALTRFLRGYDKRASYDDRGSDVDSE